MSLDQELNLKAQGFADRATAAYRERNYTEAIANYSELIRLKPKDARVYYNRGSAYHKLKDLERALGDFDRAIRLDPAFSLALMNRGNIYSKKGLYNEAIADFDRAIVLKPNDFLVVFNRGVTKRALGHLREALADFSKAIELNRWDAPSFAERGIVQLQLKQLEGAESDLLAAQKLDPENARAAAGLQILRKNVRSANSNTQSVLDLMQRQKALGDLFELAKATCFAIGEDSEKLRDIAVQKQWNQQAADQLAQASSTEATVINGWVAKMDFGEIAVIQSKVTATRTAFVCSMTVKIDQVWRFEEAQSAFKTHFRDAVVATEFAPSSNTARYWLPHSSKCDAMTSVVIGPDESLLTVRVFHGRLRGEGI